MQERQSKILTIDDKPLNIQLIGAILRKENYEVGSAQNGQEALELLKENSDFDLILLDVNMPIMNGYETCLEIRKIPALRDIPIIFLTAISDIENVIKGFDTGGQDYVSKPFNAKELLARVRTHIELKNSRKKLEQINQKLELKVKERTFELQKANKELEELDEIKADFLNIISHEINTPLNGIIGFASLLKDALKDHEFYEMLDLLDISAKRLERFSSISLLITELRANRKSLYWEQIDGKSIVNESLYAFNEQLEKKELILDFPEGEQLIWGDRELVRKCIDNLLDNAIKFSPQNGNIHLSIEERNDYTVFLIENEGVNFSPEILENPFKLFSYGKELQEENKGLGLALIKLIMEAHKGEIKVGNRDSGGAYAKLYFKKYEI